MTTAASFRPYDASDSRADALLARVAAAIAAAGPEPDAFVPAALGAIVEATHASGGAIVAGAPDAPVVRWHVGASGATFAGEATSETGTRRFAIPHTSTDRGTAELVLVAAAKPVTDVALGAPLALLGGVLGAADRAQDLAAEVDAQVRAAADERDFAAAVIDALPVGVYVTDREHRVRLWNRKREVDTLGVAREAAIGRTVFEVLPRQDAALVRRELDDVLGNGVVRQIDTESTASGEARIYRLSKIPMAFGADEPTHVITLGEDVTEWRSALERTAQAEKLAAVGQLAAGVMHEINNPLGTIAACAETMTLALSELPREQHPAGFAEYLRIVDHEVHRCRRIVDGLL
ncbi:MAG TPA: PAS domain-containing protein, partial [Gemmatirosa sp.]